MTQNQNNIGNTAQDNGINFRIGSYDIAHLTEPDVLPPASAPCTDCRASMQVVIGKNGTAFDRETFVAALGAMLDVARDEIDVTSASDEGLRFRVEMPFGAARRLYELAQNFGRKTSSSLLSKILSFLPKTKGDWIQILAAFGYVGISFAFYFILEPLLNNPDQFKAEVRAAGIWGPIIYVLIYSLQVFIPFLPGVSMDAVSGALWGVGGTLILSVGSASLAGAIIIPVVRKLGLQNINKKFPALLDGPWRFVRIAEKWPWTLAIVATLGGDASYFVAGATRVPAWKALLVIGLARFPGVIGYSLVGWLVETGRASERFVEQFSVLVPLFSVVTIVALLVGVTLLARYSERFIDRLERLLEGNHSVKAEAEETEEAGEKV
ncbi:MAG: TVP38/TMEM64 family protein [Anaerolineae bacterium]|nr:TVP38/TMEM64 family protein [Anaerolineae bacterium]